MVIDVSKVESGFEWESFKDGMPYLGTFQLEIPGRVKMMTQKLDLKDWVKIDRSYASQQREKERLESTLDPSLLFVSNDAPSTADAKLETLQLLVDYLPRRFPDKFESRPGGVFNKMLEEFVSVGDEEGQIDPLLRAARLTQEDWCVMEWNESEGAYCLTAAALYFPMRWSLREKWNKPMMGIHQPVDGFVNHLAVKVADLFKAMSPDGPVYRGNWAVFNDLDGPLDLYTPTGHEDRNASQSTVQRYEGAATGEALVFRAEYQTLRKLPRSRAILFGIRTYQFRLKEFLTFPRSKAETLLRVVRNIHPDFVKYKGAEFWRDATEAYLERDVLGVKTVGREGACTLGNCGAVAAAVVSVAAMAMVSWYLFVRKK